MCSAVARVFRPSGVWPVAGRHHRGRAAVRQRRVVGRPAWPRRRVPGLYAVRRHTVRIRGQVGTVRHTQLLRGLRARSGGIRGALQPHARVARSPIR